MTNETGPSADLLNSAALRGELVSLFETLVNVMFCAKDTDVIPLAMVGLLDIAIAP